MNLTAMIYQRSEEKTKQHTGGSEGDCGHAIQYRISSEDKKGLTSEYLHRLHVEFGGRFRRVSFPAHNSEAVFTRCFDGKVRIS